MKKRIKVILRRVLTVFLGVALVASVTFVAAIAAASFDDILGIEDDDALDFIRAGIMQGYGISPEGLTLEYFTSYYDYVSKDWWGLAAGSGGVYNSDGSFNDTYLTACEQQVAMFFAGNGIPFDWAEFLEYAKSRRSSELAGSSFSDDEYSAANDVSPIHISGEMLKAVYTDYSLMYAPMSTPSQYLYSYQNVTGTRNGKSFYPYAPVYRYGRGWGCNVGQSFGWSEGCYLLGFLRDDDVGDTLYAECYQHFFFTKSDDGTVLFNYEVFSLIDGSLLYSGNTPYVSSGFYGLESANRLAIYLSDFKYLINDNAGIAYYQFSYPRYNYYYSGKISQIVKTAFNTYFNATTFTPQTNTADDWGYIMSETPFELFANQTSIDYSRIPNNYTITINGDTIYDYSITNPDTGDSTTIKKYIDDDYDFPDVPDLPDVPDPGDDSGTGGKVEVSGKIDVSGKVDVDVNVNVNSGSNSPDIPLPTLEGLDEGEQGIGDLIDYYQDSADQIGGFFSSFMSIVPEPIRNMIPLSLGLIIFLGLVHALRR